jgi:hypothetical protein
MGPGGTEQVLIYFKIQRVHRCDRCGMQYPWRLNQCPHCSALTDEELVLFKQRRKQELNEIAGLGRVFLGLAILLLILMVFVATS